MCLRQGLSIARLTFVHTHTPHFFFFFFRKSLIIEWELLKIKQCATDTQSCMRSIASGQQKLRDGAGVLTDSGVSVLLVIKSAACVSTGSHYQFSWAQSEGHNGGWLKGTERSERDSRGAAVVMVEMLDDRMGRKITPSRRILAKRETKKGGRQCSITTQTLSSFLILSSPLILSLSAGCLHVAPTTWSCRGRSSSWRRPTGESSQKADKCCDFRLFSVSDWLIYRTLLLEQSLFNYKLNYGYPQRKTNTQIINHGFMCAHTDSTGN